WAALEGVLDRLEQRDRLTVLLENAISRLEAGVHRAALRVKLAKLLNDRPGNTASAIELLTGALEDDPSDHSGVDLLSSMLEAEGRFGELATLLERKFAALGKKPAADLEMGWRLAHALERADRPKDALALYDSLLDVRPLGLDKVRELAGRLEALGSARLA